MESSRRSSFKDCSKLGDAEFRLIGQPRNLKSPTRYGQCKGLTDETFPHLSGLTKLEEFSTDAMQVTDAGLRNLRFERRQSRRLQRAKK